MLLTDRFNIEITRYSAFDESKVKRDDGGQFSVKSGTKKMGETSVTRDALFRRSKSELQEIGESLGVKRQKVGQAGVDQINKALANHEAGSVIAALLSVDDENAGYTGAGFADRGGDVFIESLDGKFTQKQLDAAVEWLGDFNRFPDVKERRWLRGSVQAASPKGDVESRTKKTGESESKPTSRSAPENSVGSLLNDDSVKSAIKSIQQKIDSGTFRPFGDRNTPSDWHILIDAIADAANISPGKAMSMTQSVWDKHRDSYSRRLSRQVYSRLLSNRFDTEIQRYSGANIALTQ